MSKDVQSASARVLAICGVEHEDTPSHAMARARARLAGARELIALGLACPAVPFNGDCLLGIQYLLRDAYADLQAHGLADPEQPYTGPFEGLLTLTKRMAPTLELLEDGLEPSTLRLLLPMVDELLAGTARQWIARCAA